MYRKYFNILVFSFIGVLALELITTALGHPIVNVYIAGLGNTDTWKWLVQPVISGLVISGIINVFLMFKILKKLFKFNRWPSPLIVLFTLLFPLEILIGTVLLIPNITIFLIKSIREKA